MFQLNLSSGDRLSQLRAKPGLGAARPGPPSCNRNLGLLLSLPPRLSQKIVLQQDSYRSDAKASAVPRSVGVISGSAAISRIFPADVVTISFEPSRLSNELYPQEARHVAMAVQKRRQEFAAGRACAREALRQLGFGEPAVVSSNDGAPIWPPGVVGSITHCLGYCGAAVARRGHIVGLGVDAEPIGELPPDLRPLVCSERERRWIDAHQGAYVTDLYKMMFSAKESVFKAIYPLVRCMVAFEDVTIRIEPGAAIFHIELAPWLAEQISGRIIGRSLLTSSHVFTGVTLGGTATW